MPLPKNTEKIITQIYQAVFKKVFSPREIAKLSQPGKEKELEKQIDSLKSSPKYDKFCKEFAIKLSKKGMSHQKAEWRKYFKEAKRKHTLGLPDTYTEYEKQLMIKTVKHNFDMIKSIPDHVLSVYKQQLIQSLVKEVAEGKASRGSFKKELASHGQKNAQLIARTETAKLRTFILENRASDLGSVAYMWLASKDKRTRPSHRAMDGVIVFWRSFDEKPLLDNMRGNAGEFPNCRCSPEPIFDEDDLTKAVYKVYDYRTNSIISMRRIELIEALKKGSL